MKLTHIRGHYVWTPPLNGQSVVIDAGAHRGEFSAEIIRRFGCQCHLIEANPFLAENLVVQKAASLTPAALGGRDGKAVFHVRENPEAGSLGAAGAVALAALEVETISLPTLMQRVNVDHIDLLKLDIEGAEFDLIKETPDETLCSIGQITVEFHDFQEQFAGRGLFEEARERLETLGFVCCRMSFRTNGDVLFFNQNLLRLSIPQILYVQSVARFVERTRARISC